MKELFGLCGLRQHEFLSIDGDEDFLLIALDDEEVISEIGKEEEFPVTCHEAENKKDLEHIYYIYI